MRSERIATLIVKRVTAVALPGLLLIAVAFCKPLLANTLNDIDNHQLRRYTISELEKGAVSLQVPARAIYREALESLAAGDRDGARRKLLMAAELSGDLPDPMFTLARLELSSGDPEGLFHLAEGAKRLVRGFYGQALIAANAVILSIAVATAVLLCSMVWLLIRHWPRIDHLIRERWAKRIAFPPARFIGPLVILGLLIARLGFALYAGLLLVVLWPMISRREKAAILPLVVFLGACSVLAPRMESYLPAIDEGSITRRLASLEDRGADPALVESIGRISDAEFVPEREYALGTLLYRLGRYDEARQHLLDCVSLRGDFAPAYLNLGNVYFRQGDFSRALAGYQNVMAIDSTNAVASYNIGQAYINRMLFAESSEALQRARELGIEEYRRANPAARLLELDIYDHGLPASQLWSIAEREGRGHGAAVLDGIFLPWLLVPLSRLWIVLAAGLAGGIAIGALSRGGLRVAGCDNCGRPVCASCGTDEDGVELCHDCTTVISGLSSVKVMEALLRHRRQKTRARRGRGDWWKARIVPGSAQILYGRPISGVLAMIVAGAALITLLWGGLYLDDPRRTGLHPITWTTAVPALVVLFCWLATVRTRRGAEQLNYRILPPDFRFSQIGASDASAPRRDTGQESGGARNEADRQFAEFLDSL